MVKNKPFVCLLAFYDIQNCELINAFISFIIFILLFFSPSIPHNSISITVSFKSCDQCICSLSVDPE